MKNSGLRNRFSPEVRLNWLYWYSCMVCGMNSIDTLHHIISPSNHLYIDGPHNESVFNSCPIHNMLHPNATKMQHDGNEGFGITQPCHVGNETYLYTDETIVKLLRKTRDALEDMGYNLNTKDREFFQIYQHLIFKK